MGTTVSARLSFSPAAVFSTRALFSLSSAVPPTVFSLGFFCSAFSFSPSVFSPISVSEVSLPLAAVFACAKSVFVWPISAASEPTVIFPVGVSSSRISLSVSVFSASAFWAVSVSCSVLWTTSIFSVISVSWTFFSSWISLVLVSRTIFSPTPIFSGS